MTCTTGSSVESQRVTGISPASSSVTVEPERARGIDDEKVTKRLVTESKKGPSLEYGTANDGALDYSGAAKKNDPREIELVKKLDWHIMPMLWLMYWLNYLDRNAIAHARLNHLEKDLGLTGTQYNTCVSILFVGYLVGQVPSNMFITRTRPSIYMCICMMTWAIVSGCTALAKDYKGLLLTRLLLGITEAPYYPGALYLLSIFYTRKEIATRISILYTGNILATAFSGLIAAGVFYGLDGTRGLAGWRWLFILEGVSTFLVATCAMWSLPDTPLTTRWLSPEERILAHERIERDTVNRNGNKISTWEGLRQAAADPRTWVFALMQNLHLSANGFKNFFPTVVETLGFSETITLVLTCPPYLIAGIFTIPYSYSSGYFNERTIHISLSKLVAIAGFILACATLNIPTRYFAMCLFSVGTYCVNSIILGWAASTLGQTSEKKAVALSIINSCANASFVFTPYLFPKSDEPRYTMAMVSSAAFSAGCMVCGWILRFWLKRENKKMRAQREMELSTQGNGLQTIDKNFYVY